MSPWLFFFCKLSADSQLIPRAPSYCEGPRGWWNPGYCSGGDTCSVCKCMRWRWPSHTEVGKMQHITIVSARAHQSQLELTATPMPSLIFALGCYPSEQHHYKDSDCSPPFLMAIFHERLSWRVFSVSSFVSCFLASSSSSFCRAFLNPFCIAFILVE